MPTISDLVNNQFRLAAVPPGPDRAHFTSTQEPVREPEQGELVVKVPYISLDPAMRGWMNDARSYVAPVAIGDVMRAIGLGRVIASRDRRFVEGDHVTGVFGVQEYALTDGDGAVKVAAELAPPPVYLNTLGLPGMSAYVGLLDIGQPKPGEIVVVCAAAGAVGATAGRIAKISGCRVIGIAGGEKKCRLVVDELGFDAAIIEKAWCRRFRFEHNPGRPETASDDHRDPRLESVGNGP